MENEKEIGLIFLQLQDLERESLIAGHLYNCMLEPFPPHPWNKVAFPPKEEGALQSLKSIIIGKFNVNLKPLFRCTTAPVSL